MRTARSFSLVVVLSVIVGLLSGCGYNQIQTDDEADESSSWAEVLNQYKRRSDLVPNLVNVVKGYATHEHDVLGARHRRARQGRLHQRHPVNAQRPASDGEFR